MRVADGVLRAVVRSGVLMSLSRTLAWGVVLAGGMALPVRADDAVLYLGETDPRPLEVDGGPAASLPMIRFTIGALDEAGSRRVTVHELRSLGEPLPEVADAVVVIDLTPALSSPAHGLIRLAVVMQAAERWATTFDIVPLDDDGRVRVVATGSELRSDGLTPGSFGRELSGWFLVYPEEPAASEQLQGPR